MKSVGSFALAATLATLSLQPVVAHASAGTSVSVNQTAVDNDIAVTLMNGTFNSVYNPAFGGFITNGIFNIGRSALQGVAPATITPRWVGGNLPILRFLQVSGPVSALSFTGSHATGKATIESVSTAGGFSFTFANDEFFSTGGSLSITNLRVSLADKTVYADLQGDGASATTGLAFFNFVQTLGDPTLLAGQESGRSLTANQLRLTTEGRSYLIQALGLSGYEGEFAVDELLSIPFGSLTVNIATKVSAVPEPAGYLLAGASLAMALVLSARVRKQAA